jgi:4-hydroxy-tetrahydrodipicolinate reductase
MTGVLVCGALGRMGREVVGAVRAQTDMTVVGAVDPAAGVHADLGEAYGDAAMAVPLRASLAEALDACQPEVLVDFTRGDAAPASLLLALERGVRCVVGTTGISAVDLQRIESASSGSACLIVPNFALGAVLMMRFAAEAAKYYEWAEVIELHHEKKVDAPSGTALRTAEMMRAQRSTFGSVAGESEKMPGARGALHEGVRVHSVRLAGLVAHQEVLLGGLGETLTIRHDSMARTSFMPGVVLAVRRIGTLSGYHVGLENVMD